MKLNLIWAQSANRVIGKNNAMPWHLPEDLAHFKELTLGCPVIMGRKTWDSILPKFRPLPGRTNIVVTRQSDWQPVGANTAGSLQAALAQCHGASDVWIIGGAQIYAQAEPLAIRIEVTDIYKTYEGDAFAPKLGAQWLQGQKQHHVSSTGLNFSFCTYTRQQPHQQGT